VRSLERVPWTIAAYIAIVLGLMAVLLGEDDPRAFGGALILLAASVGLLLGFWLAWAFLVALHLGNLILVATQMAGVGVANPFRECLDGRSSSLRADTPLSKVAEVPRAVRTLMPTALDSGQRSTRKQLAAVVRQVIYLCAGHASRARKSRKRC
jgi:hypothetical protein